MNDRVFVYGTLKSGYPNFHINAGRRVAGDFVTVERFPLYVIGSHQVPWLVNRKGEGHAVTGQLFEVDAATLAAMDVLERIDEPQQWYTRSRIAVRPSNGPAAAATQTWVYFGSAERLAAEVIHCGPIAEYSLQLAQSYRPDETGN